MQNDLSQDTNENTFNKSTKYNNNSYNEKNEKIHAHIIWNKRSLRKQKIKTVETNAKLHIQKCSFCG